MIRTICCKLTLDATADAHLRATQVAFNMAATWCAAVGWQLGIANKITLHDHVYYPIRAQFALGAQLTCCARDKAVEAIKTVRQHGDTSCPPFGPTSSIRYDARSYSLLASDQVSLNTLHGRVRATLILGDFQRQALADSAWAIGGAELIRRDATWYLHVTQNQPVPVHRPIRSSIGCDLGIVNLCTTDDGTQFSGATVKRIREKRFRHRQRLQKRGTRNAKRRLKKNSRKEQRFQKDINHCMSKTLVKKAVVEQKALRLEDLTHIRQRTEATVRRSQRRQHSSWAFRQLRDYITYKAQQVGIPVILVNPRDTSRRCFVCGHIDNANRKTQAAFHCQNPSCGHIAAADVNAAKNIAFWAEVSQPIASPLRR
ncbi:MAG: IS200/IS605 family element transposase accessory protein TnpB [Herpetosiphonaceae bacterium]|nr:IS200/IS605 family element transposase accessory protein TnpB [Herpetosiphonaceae bacterium]